MQFALRLTVFFALGLFAFDALACRCAQRPLAEYYADADEVVFGRLVLASEHDNERHLEFSLVTGPFKTSGLRTASIATGDVVGYATGVSSAECGMVPVSDAVYILFATDDPEKPGRRLINSCNGSRVHLSKDGAQPQGFDDVPARFVVKQLEALSALDVLRDVAANRPRENDDTNGALIGLLDIKSLAHGASVPVHAEANEQSAVIGIVDDYDAIDSLEASYEAAAAVVLGRRNGWYRVRLADGAAGWIAPEHGGTWFGYAELPVRRLAYLNEHWSGFVWPDAGAGIPARSGLRHSQTRKQFAAEVHESKVVGGLVWFRVSVLVSSPCDGGESRPTLSGWVPGYGASGEPTVWFHSRGC